MKGGAEGSHRGRRTYLLSAVMVAMSFTAMIIPLAMYHVAQVAAAVGRNQSFLLLLAVVGFLFLLGFASGEQLFVVSAFSGLLWSPAFLFGLSQREKGSGVRGLVLTTVVMSFLPAMLLAAVLLPPPLESLVDYLDGLGGMLAAGGASTDPQSLETLNQVVEELKSSEQIPLLAAVLESSWPTRLMWLVFGTGNPWLFALFLVTVGNLILLDMAYDQVERMRSVLAHVTSHKDRFGERLVRSLQPLGAALSQGDSERFQVVKVRRDAAEEEKKPFWTRFVRSKESVGELGVLGHWFHLQADRTKRWGLRELQAPLIPALASIIGLLALGVNQQVLSDKGHPLSDVETSSVVSILALLCFLGSALVATQGVLVALQRLTPLGLLLLLILFVFTGGFVAANPLLVIAVFGTVGLLDHQYDLRNLKAQSRAGPR